MKKSSMTLIALLLCLLLLISANAESEDPTANGENIVPFGLDATVEDVGLCEMSWLYAEVLDDDAISEGWYYYYTDSDESPARVINWEPSEGNYTTAEVLFSLKNTSDKPQTFGDKVTAQLIYQEDENSPAVIFVGTVFQQNPGQVDENGEMIMWSTKPVEIAVGETANVSFRFDIPRDVYEKVFATAIGEDTGIEEICEFSFGEETTFIIDLCDVLILASRYDG